MKKFTVLGFYRLKGVFYSSILCFVILLTFSTVSVNANNSITKDNDNALLNRITGFVFDSNRTPIPNMYILLENELNQLISRVRTDSGGRYVFSGMSAGTFFVRVVPAGTNYVEQSIRVRVVNLGPRGGSFGQSDDVTQDFYLKSRKKTSDINFSPGVLYVQKIPKQAEEFYKQAIKMLEKEKLTEGENLLKKSLTEFPDYFFALNRLGYMYFEQTKYVEASEQFARAAQINPKSEPTIYLLAYSVFLTKRYDTTIEVLRAGLGHNHQTPRIYLLFGKSFRAKKNYKTAEIAFKKAEKLSKSKNPNIHWELATLYGNKLKEYGKAAKQLELFIKLKPKHQDKEKIKKLIASFKEKEKQK